MRKQPTNYKAIFVGMYPNPADKYLNAFFQNLIYAIADIGIECTVISPVSITKYRRKISLIPRKTFDYSLQGKQISVYFPRYISVSGKKIGKFNTRIITEYFFQKAAYNQASKLPVLYDFIYGHFILDGGLASIKIGKKLNIPAFFAYGECDFTSQVKYYYRKLYKKDFDGLYGIISVSKKNTEELNELSLLKDFPILTAPNGVNLELFKIINKAIAREKFKIPENLFVVGFVGGFIDRKGDKRLLEAVNKIDNVFVAFAGRGLNPPTGDKVVFCESLNHDQIPYFLSALDLFVLPSLSEGSSNAILEAMACGVPVISSNLTFNDDILNESNSVRINPNSIDEIQNAINFLYKNNTLRIKLSEESIKTAKVFDIHLRAERIINFIIHTINEKQESENKCDQRML